MSDEQISNASGSFILGDALRAVADRIARLYDHAYQSDVRAGIAADLRALAASQTSITPNGPDAVRFRFLADTHYGETKLIRDRILAKLPTLSYGGACEEIDRVISATGYEQ